MDTANQDTSHTLEVLTDPNGNKTFIMTSEAGSFSAQDYELALRCHNAMFTYSGLSAEDKTVVDNILGGQDGS